MPSSLLRRARRAGLVAFALPLACVGKAPLSSRAPDPGAVHYRVMSFNVHRYRSDDGPTIDTVGSVDAEIVCLQEVTAKWEAVLRARYQSQYEHMLFAPDEDAGGLAVLSHFPIADRGLIPAAPGFHPASVVEVKTPGGPIQILNLHLRSLFEGGSPTPVGNYLESDGDHVRELDGQLAHLVAGTPTVVVGDFNESPDGDAVHDIESRGFANALPLFHPGQFTWHGASVGGALELAIDHVMFDATAFTPLDAGVLRRGNSDHLPVLVHLQMAAASAAQR